MTLTIVWLSVPDSKVKYQRSRWMFDRLFVLGRGAGAAALKVPEVSWVQL
jgi:hypothetical protein